MISQKRHDKHVLSRYQKTRPTTRITEHSLPLFATITILPCLLAAAAALWGGLWIWVVLVYMTALVAVFDQLIAANTKNTDPEAEFPASTALLVTLGGFHFLILALALWAIAGPSHLAIVERIVLGIAAGLIFGQISHPVAHELIHQRKRVLRLIGRCIYTTLFAGHHASAHLLVHHVHVGSDLDPNSAPRGENFYRYMLRVGIQSFRAGLKVETERRRRAAKSAIGHPYLLYVGGAAAAFAVALLVLGPIGGVAYISIALHAQIQILMSDYVQHYGLRRHADSTGRLEPVGSQHSWNAPNVFSSFLMVNAPRHSDHHTTPSRNYPALQISPDTMPILPYSLPVMGLLALFPKVWFRLMNPRLKDWQRPADDKHTSPLSGGQSDPGLSLSSHESDAVFSASSELRVPR
jgi:alkane 1-monooxygenase